MFIWCRIQIYYFSFEQHFLTQKMCLWPMVKPVKNFQIDAKAYCYCMVPIPGNYNQRLNGLNNMQNSKKKR